MAHTDLLQSLPDDELLRRLCALLGESRRVEADLVAHIGEVDERRLYVREACSSMHVYCTERLHLSDAEAYRRIVVARAARKHPQLLAMLADGRLHLSGAALLVPHLSDANRDSVLARATHASKRELEKLAAELRPLPDVPAGMRKLPERRPASGALVSSPAPPAAAASPSSVHPAAEGGFALLSEDSVAPLLVPAGGAAEARRELAPGRVADGRVHGHPEPVPPADCHPGLVSDQPAAGNEAGACARPSERGRVEPLAPGRYKVTFTASAELREKLEQLQDLVGDGDLAAVIEEAVTDKLQRLLARRFAVTDKPRSTPAAEPEAPSSRHVPAAVRRAVYRRDGGRCAFVDREGRRCTERKRLELHHRHPFGYGGRHTVSDCQILCGPHHAYVTEIDFGPAARQRGRGNGSQAGSSADGV